MRNLQVKKEPAVHVEQEDRGQATDMDVGGINRKQQRLNSPGAFCVCRISTHNAGLYSYVVTGVGAQARNAVDIQDSLSIFGARGFRAYPVGTDVLVWFAAEDDPLGYIVGAMPTPDAVEFQKRGALLFGGSPAGFGRDNAHNIVPAEYIKSQDSLDGRQNVFFNNGRPWDVLGGDWGEINDMGVGIGLWRMFTSLFAGAAQIAVSLVDDSIRLHAHRITEETLTTEGYKYVDGVEGSEVRFMTPFLHEGLGAFQYGTSPSDYREPTLSAVSPSKEDARAPFEPQYWDQLGIFRMTELSGYLGDLFHQWYGLPGESTGTHRRSSSGERWNWPGVFDMHIGADGFTAIRTAKGLLFEKTCAIPYPELVREPWDPLGDHPAHNSTPLATERYDYDWQTSEPMARAALAVDHNAFRTGLSDVRPLVEHVDDWHLPEDSEAAIVSASESLFASLGSTFRFDLPGSKNVAVDSRRPAVKYYPTKSFILFTDDGGIQLQDGYGSVISMTGGNIEISAPGDVIVRPGRRVVAMAPNDLILRAGNNVEVSAGKGDVRIKAEKNFHMLAGNSGSGGLLLESRSVGEDHTFLARQGQGVVSSGIQLKAANSSISGWAANVYLRSLGGALASGSVVGSGGRVVLDASAGGGEVSLIGKTIQSLASDRQRTIVGLRAGTGEEPSRNFSLVEQTSDRFSSKVGRTLMSVEGGKMSLMGDGQTSAELFVEGDGEFSGILHARVDTIQKLESSRLVTTTSQINVARLKVDAGVNQFFGAGASPGEYDTLVETLYENRSTSWGNPDYISETQFSFNSSAQYNTDSSRSFSLFENPWQSRMSGGVTWDEPTVSFGGGVSCPWPGNETWAGAKAYGKMSTELKNVDLATGLGKPRAGRTDPKGQPPLMDVFTDRYVVSLQT